MKLENGSTIIQRAVVADILLALLFSQDQVAGSLVADPYSAGYSQGYQDALRAMALAVGVEGKLPRLVCEVAR